LPTYSQRDGSNVDPKCRSERCRIFTAPSTGAGLDAGDAGFVLVPPGPLGVGIAATRPFKAHSTRLLCAPT
jgi:hypothetical protein